MLKGAMVCEAEGDEDAVRDCAELLCRSYGSVRQRANVLENNIRRELALSGVKFRKAIWLTHERPHVEARP